MAIDAAASPAPPSPEAEAFYAEALRDLGRLGVPFLLSGTYAVAAYTGVSRPTKDLDIFCKAGDLPRILAPFQALGYGVEIEDERWIGKVRRGALFFDVIFASSNGTMPVNDQWFEAARQVEVLRALQLIAEKGRMSWQNASGYNARARAEAAVSRTNA